MIPGAHCSRCGAAYILPMPGDGGRCKTCNEIVAEIAAQIEKDARLCEKQADEYASFLSRESAVRESECRQLASAIRAQQGAELRSGTAIAAVDDAYARGQREATERIVGMLKSGKYPMMDALLRAIEFGEGE